MHAPFINRLIGTTTPSATLYLLLFLFAPNLNAATIHVPADQPTIQAGIDAAIPGDTVLVADGTYTGPGNRDIDFGGKNIVLKSVNGPEVTIIDCQGSVADPHRGFKFQHGEDSTAVVEGFTIQGGVVGPRAVGGGILINSSSPTIRGNIIRGNSADPAGGIYCASSISKIIDNTISGNSSGGPGGGIYCTGSNPTISNNIIRDNSARVGGGIFCGSSNPTISANIISGNSAGGSNGSGIYFGNSSPTISSNTISGNSAFLGNTIFLDRSSPSFENNIFAFNIGSELIRCFDETSIPTLTCCDVYGNTGGDWTGCIADQAGINGNFSADPLFCDTAAGDYHIDGFSPCATPFSPCGELVGALDVGCNSNICGDLNDDGLVTFDDVDALIDLYFRFIPPPAPLGRANVDCSEHIDLADIVYLIYFVRGVIPELCCLNTPAPPDRQRIYWEVVDAK